MARLEQQLRHWLAMLKIPVAAAFQEQQLLSHPGYPSLLSVTDTLDRLGIEILSQITFTPSLFINGYPLPPSYTVFDSPSLMDGICSHINSKQPASIV